MNMLQNHFDDLRVVRAVSFLCALPVFLALLAPGRHPPKVIENEAGELQELPYLKGVTELLPESQPVPESKR